MIISGVEQTYDILLISSIGPGDKSVQNSSKVEKQNGTVKMKTLTHTAHTEVCVCVCRLMSIGGC